MKRLRPHELRPGDQILELSQRGTSKVVTTVKSIDLAPNSSCNGVHIEPPGSGVTECWDRAVTIWVNRA